MSKPPKTPKLPSFSERVEMITALAIFFAAAVGGEIMQNNALWSFRCAGAMAACFVFLMYHVGKGLDENGGFDDFEDDGKDNGEDKKDKK